MTTPAVVYLMYHELELPGRALVASDSGYVRYVLPEREFRAQIEHLKSSGYCGLSVGQALNQSGGKPIVITFDDGSETDLLAAAPILRAAGYNATFYLTVGWIGKPGHLSAAQVVELVAQGFEIGCHSMTHAYLADLDEAGLHREIAEAKSRLEQITSTPVEHYSCPGGRYDDRVAKVARGAGYKTVATSRIQANSAATDRFALGRVAILRGLPIEEFASICTGEALPHLRRRSGLREAAKRVLGSSLYDRMRGVLLGRGKSAH